MIEAPWSGVPNREVARERTCSRRGHVLRCASGHVLAARLALTAALFVPGCASDSPSQVPPGELTMGTWGAEMVGIVVGDVVAHVHVGCTKGDFPAPIALDEDRRFSVSGEYLLKAYPVAIGPTMPAELAGVLDGNDLTFTVAVNDTIDDTLVVLGPATVSFGREPMMGPCPICEGPR